MKPFIISLSISLFYNVLCDTTLIGHFSLFYLQVMILFVIEEIHLRWNERFNYWDDHVSTRDIEYNKLLEAISLIPQVESDVTELGFILVPEDIFIECTGPLQQFKQVWNNNRHESIGLEWLVACGYTADKLKELEEDMPRILAYLRNVQTFKAIEAL